jgi:hypothetical protein
MRTTCFVLGTLCLVMSAVWIGIGLLDLLAGGPSSSTPQTTGLRMNSAAAASIDLRSFDFGTTAMLAQVSAIAGVGWMIAASALKPARAVPAASPEARPWQPQHQAHHPQAQQPQAQQPQNQQSTAQSQPYAPQWQQQAPPHQHPEQQS